MAPPRGTAVSEDKPPTSARAKTPKQITPPLVNITNSSDRSKDEAAGKDAAVGAEGDMVAAAPVATLVGRRTGNGGAEGIESDDEDVVQHEKYQRLLENDLRKTGCILPTSASYMRWSFLVFLVSVYNFIYVLMGCAFEPGVPVALVVIDSILDIVWIIDIVVNNYLGRVQEGVLITDLGSVRRMYWSQWGVLDLVTALPLHFISFKVNVYPFLRLGKLLRVGKWRDYFNRWQRELGVPNVVRLAGIVTVTGSITHILTILYWTIVRVEGFGETRWTPQRSDLSTSPLVNYASATYTVANMMSVSGGGVNGAEPERGIEYGFTLFTMFVGVVIYALVIGTAATLLANLNENRRRFNNRVNAINKYMAKRNINPNVRGRVRDYYNYLWNRQHGYNDNEIIASLPAHLQLTVCLQLYKELLSKVEFFKDCSQNFIDSLVVKLQSEVYAPGDFIIRQGDIGQEMYFISGGQVDVIISGGKAVNTIGEGEFFGEIALLHSLTRTASVVARSYCEVLRLSRQGLEEALILYPEQLAKIEAIAGARFHATNEVLIKENKKRKRRNALGMAVNGSHATLGGSESSEMRIDRAHSIESLTAIDEESDGSEVSIRRIPPLLTHTLREHNDSMGLLGSQAHQDHAVMGRNRRPSSALPVAIHQQYSRPISGHIPLLELDAMMAGDKNELLNRLNTIHHELPSVLPDMSETDIGHLQLSLSEMIAAVGRHRISVGTQPSHTAPHSPAMARNNKEPEPAAVGIPRSGSAMRRRLSLSSQGGAGPPPLPQFVPGAGPVSPGVTAAASANGMPPRAPGRNPSPPEDGLLVSPEMPAMRRRHTEGMMVESRPTPVKGTLTSNMLHTLEEQEEEVCIE